MFDTQMYTVEVEIIGQRTYRVWYGDELLLDNTLDPEGAVCRVFHARGLRGWLEISLKGTNVTSIPLNIVKKASEDRVFPGKALRIEIAAKRQAEKRALEFTTPSAGVVPEN